MISTPEHFLGRAWRAALAAFACMCLAGPLAAQFPRAAQDAFQQGLEALERRDGVAAEIAFRRALDAGAASEDVSARLGQAYLFQGQYDHARQWLEEGNFSPSERSHGYHILALLEMAEGNLPASGAAFDKALDGNEGTAAIWVDIGRLRYRGGEHHQAFEAALEALRLGPEDARALEFRGQLARDAEGFMAALPWFEKGLEAEPDDLSLLGEYAAALGEAGRAKDMLRVTRQMIELDPANPRAFFLQAVLAARAGNNTLARRLIWRAGNSYDQMPAMLLLKGVLEMRAGNHALAAEAFARLVRLQPENGRGQLLFARALLENGEPREVIARYRILAERKDAAPYLLTLVGRAYEMLDDREAASTYLDRAAMQPDWQVMPLHVSDDGELAIFRWGNDPYRLDAMVPSVRKLLEQGRGEEAMAIIMRIAGSYPGSVDVQTLSGDVAFARGDFTRALDDYGVAARIRRPFALVQRMAAVMEMLGQDAQARALVSDFLIQHPLNADAAELLGRLQEKKGDLTRARLLYSHARTLRGGNERDPLLAGNLALTELALDNPEQALRHAEAAYTMQRANRRTAEILARTLQSAGREAEAQVLLKKARPQG